jgi:hypothetical protein
MTQSAQASSLGALYIGEGNPLLLQGNLQSSLAPRLLLPILFLLQGYYFRSSSCSKATTSDPLLAPRQLVLLQHHGDLDNLAEKIELHLLHGYTQYKMGSFWPIKPVGRFTPESSGEVTVNASCNFGV